MLTGSFLGDDSFGYFGAAAKKAVKKVVVKKPVKKVVAKGPALTARKGIAHFTTPAGPATTARSGVAHFVTAATNQAVAATASTAPGSSAMRLQADLVTLGRIIKDGVLMAIKVDGALGAKTAAAVNRAFTKHLGAGQAPAQYRTGKMPLVYIKNNATVLTTYLENEIRRRGGTVVPPETVAGAKAVAKASKKAAAAQKAAAKKAAAAAKALAAKQKAAAKKQAAAAKKAKAAALRARVASAPPAEIRQIQAEVTALDKEAAAAESAASAAEQATEAAATEAAHAAVEEQVATTAAVKEATAAVTPTPAAAAEAAVTAVAAEATRELAPPSAAEPVMIPGSGEESFFSKYKLPIIGGGAIALLGLLALAMKRPSGSSTPSPARR